MGWLGWTEEQLLKTDVNAIEIAINGRLEMLRAIFGGKPDKDEVRTSSSTPKDARGKPIIITPKTFDLIFGASKPKKGRK